MMEKKTEVVLQKFSFQMNYCINDDDDDVDDYDDDVDYIFLLSPLLYG